jgi:hypothetical protein
MTEMLWIDRFEKLGRLIMWLAITLVLVGVPVALAKQRRGEAELRDGEVELRETLQRTKAQLAEALRPTKPTRLMISSMGPIMYWLNPATATGAVTFTNVSARVGVVCITGLAKNPETQKTSESLPACHEVGAYASGIHFTVAFESGDLANVCGKTKCKFEFRDVPQTAAEEAALLPAHQATPPAP